MFAILLSCVLIILVILWTKYYFDGQRSLLPPMAGEALPIVGHTWMGFVKKERLYDLILKSALGYSLGRDEQTVHFRAGAWKVYVCMDPDDGYLVLNSCLKKDPLYRFFNPLFGGEDGLINADVQTWKIHRKILNPSFNQSILDSYILEFNEHSRCLVELLNREVDKGYFDQLNYIKQTVLQIVYATMMGVSVDDDFDIMSQYGQSMETFTSCMIERVRKFYYHSDFLFNLSMLKKKHDTAAKTIHNLSYKVIRKKKEKLFEQEHKGTETSTPLFKSFLELLLEMGEDGALTESEIQQEVNTFITAAFDTTYHALGMTLLIIGSFPQVQEKIFDELKAVFEGSTRDVEKHDMSKLKYLEAVIKETMRLYPVVVGIGRTVDKNLQLKKYTLPAGSRCFVSIYHLGRHQSWGADAAQFRPERWLDGSLPRSSRAFAGFGLGRRSCIGSSVSPPLPAKWFLSNMYAEKNPTINFPKEIIRKNTPRSNYAMMLMKTVLCHVVRRYRISGDVTRLVQNIDIVVTPASGHHITIEQR